MGRYSREWWIDKYGEELGLQKRLEWIDKAKCTLKNMVRRYGEEEGEKRWAEFKQKCAKASSRSDIINRLGKEKGEELLNRRAQNKFHLSYWESLFPEDKDKAIDAYIAFQRRDLDFFIRKFAGDVELATSEYEKYLSIKMKKWNVRSSNYEIALRSELKNVGYLDVEDSFRLGRYTVDIKIGNVLIDFYGDFWHANPRRYSASDYHSLWNRTAEKIWESDSIRHEYIKRCGFEHVIVWEVEFNYDKVSTINRLREVIDEHR